MYKLRNVWICFLDYDSSEIPQGLLPEYAVSHAVYLIAHHPNFRRTDSTKLDKFKEWVAYS